MQIEIKKMTGTHKRLKHSILSIIGFLIVFYIGIFFVSYFYYLLSSLQVFKDSGSITGRQALWWLSVGVSLSLLSTLCAWPFALSTVTLLEQNKGSKRSRWVFAFTKFAGSMPLVLFVFVLVEVVGFEVFNFLEKIWIEMFASTNIVTQSLAFALTLLLYPLTIFPFFIKQTTIDEFFRKMLGAVIEFAEVGLVSSVIVVGLMVYILPQMILKMKSYMEQDKNLRSLEVIQSLGGTSWESIYMTVLQSMKEHFGLIVLRFTRICFFEGLMTLSLLAIFFEGGSKDRGHWGSTLSSVFMAESMSLSLDLETLSVLAGVLVICYLVFVRLESMAVKKLGEL